MYHVALSLVIDKSWIQLCLTDGDVFFNYYHHFLSDFFELIWCPETLADCYASRVSKESTHLRLEAKVELCVCWYELSKEWFLHQHDTLNVMSWATFFKNYEGKNSEAWSGDV